MGPIKKPWIVIKWQKGWFAALGLHHGLLTALCIAIFSLFGIGWYGAAFATGWYGLKEWGPGIYPPTQFEILDFLTPLLVSLAYLNFGGFNV